MLTLPTRSFSFSPEAWVFDLGSFSFPPEALESVHRDSTADESMVFVVDNSLKTHSHESCKNCRVARAKSSLTLRVNQHRRERETSARIDKSTKDCRCRNSWHRRRRNVWRGPDGRCRNSWPEGRRNSSGTTIRRPGTCENPSRSAGPGRRETTVTAGNTRMSSIPVLVTPPRKPAALPAVRQPCLLQSPENHRSNKTPVMKCFHP